MKTYDPVVMCELPWVQKILNDEIWLEGERRHQPVRPDDPVVLERVCDILLHEGAGLRERALHDLRAA
jgi:hypothetical protein